MVTDRDFCRFVLAGALESFGVNTLAVLLNVPSAEVMRWAQGRARPPAPMLLQVIDLMWPASAQATPPAAENGLPLPAQDGSIGRA